MKEVRGWAKVAANARRLADRLPFGQREAGLEEIAKSLSGVQWSTQTLRRALAALEATERLQAEADIAAADLQAYPLAAVEYASRLFRRDPEAAKIAIVGLLKGEITVAQLKRLDAEPRSLDREIGRGLKARFRKSMEKVILNAIEEKTHARLIANPLTTEVRRGAREGGEDPLRIPDFLSGGTDRSSVIPLYGSIEHRRTVALIVGPYGDPSIYQSQAFEWVAKAKALLAVFRSTILVLPQDCPVKAYQYWRAMLRARDDDLMLLKISADNRGEFLEDPYAGRELDRRM